MTKTYGEINWDDPVPIMNIKGLTARKVANLKTEIAQIQKQIIKLQQLEAEYKAQVEYHITNDITPPLKIEEVPNNCFVHDYRLCDYCMGYFDWGRQDAFLYDQDGKDLCPECLFYFVDECGVPFKEDEWLKEQRKAEKQ